MTSVIGIYMYIYIYVCVCVRVCVNQIPFCTLHATDVLNTFAAAKILKFALLANSSSDMYFFAAIGAAPLASEQSRVIGDGTYCAYE